MGIGVLYLIGPVRGGKVLEKFIRHGPHIRIRSPVRREHAGFVFRIGILGGYGYPSGRCVSKKGGESAVFLVCLWLHFQEHVGRAQVPGIEGEQRRIAGMSLGGGAVDEAGIVKDRLAVLHAGVHVIHRLRGHVVLVQDEYGHVVILGKAAHIVVHDTVQHHGIGVVQH